MKQDYQFCQLKTVDHITCVYLNHPPVNALSEGIRNEIHAILVDAARDDQTHALLFLTKDLPFSAGADIKEFSGPMKGKFFLDFYHAIAELKKPVIMGISQYALGGGLEFCMMGHHRIAHKDARLGLPEVKLGLIPGGTGTMSLPRLVGVEQALSIAATGQPISAQSALAMGLIDAIADDDLETFCLTFTKKCLADANQEWISPLQLPHPVVPSADYFAQKRSEFSEKYHGFNAPLRLLACVEASTTMPLDDGLAFEQKQFIELITGDDAAGMRYGFLSQRLAAHIPGIRVDDALAIDRVGVIGGGLMGSGIAMAFLARGFSVVCVEVDADRVVLCKNSIEKQYQKSVASGKMTAEDAADRLSRLQLTQKMSDVAACDLVIEAIFEKMSLKVELFRQLDRICDARTILASNTSGLDINAMAAVTQRPEKVIGLHFFSPAHVMRLLEIVRADRTDDVTLATALASAKRLKKIAVVVGVCPGFVGNRMIFKYFEQVVWLLLRGCRPQQIDQAMQQFGFAMGPCAMADMSGLDIWVHANPAEDSLIHQMVASGRLGQKSQRGFYDYGDDQKTPIPSPEVDALIQDYAQQQGIVSQSFDHDSIVERLLMGLISEGLHILQEKVALRASDIDTIYVNGYGFPIYRGGPLFYADQIGLQAVKEQLMDYQRSDPQVWKIAPLLDAVIESGKPLHKYQAQDD
jgi:3-hydroxyacyl-CoA dehydrogenase